MKVVLFCGGLGTRLREYSETIPKPLVDIGGNRPILWHLMKYYAHYGHKEFILCLGYQGSAIKDFFLNYNECDSNDFVLSEGGRKIEIFNNDISDWKITFIDTGINSNLGQRLMAVKEHLGDDEYFMANYSDGISDLHLPSHVENFKKNNAIATFLCVKPSQSFHAVKLSADGMVEELSHVKYSEYRINGGFFVFKKEIFDYISPGEELVEKPFQRLIEKRKLCAYNYEGFWAAIDTFKDKCRIDEMFAKGDRPWEVWNNSNKI